MIETSVSQPIILISQRVDYIKSRNETRESLDQALSRWVISANAIPLSISNTLAPETINIVLAHIKPAGILLSGGNNIGEHCGRDKTEMCLLDWAKANNVPVLGLCRGMQLIATWLGVELIPVVGHVAKKHIIQGIVSGSVNSYHEYALQQIPKGFMALAYAEDGSLEAISSNTKWPCEAWMWHPERELAFDKVWLDRFRKLMNIN